ncbi:tetraacyldisaccharide 4'-kinase [Halosquirtibacter laminarini]|uniref:Tetraacyldisaccharide 4'-kinase n=1 Tax=Halosquirtibacter laminarini TaxID=3374600 RepID=A0AC61NGF4_9BACT|nr:tetraacyldisaccharide 4'-kinase [Prolixibacteraceae bacterium]
MKNIILIPLSWIYSIVTYIRNLLYDYNLINSTEYSQPIISIGNITVGGTGKTPHTEYLIELLKQKFKVATLSRGYKRKTSGFLEVTNESTAQEVGDEPLQMKTKHKDVIVSVDEQRVRGIDILLSKEKELCPDIILLDDAFQHRKVNPGLHILLTDFNRLITRDHILPYGRLRESARERYRAQIIIITKCPRVIKPIEERLIIKELDIKPFQSLFFTTLKYGFLQPALKNQKGVEHSLKGKEILLFTGIANPTPLVDYLKSQEAEVTLLEFPDHYQFKKSDFENIVNQWEKLSSQEKLILTTDKDLMRVKDIEGLPLAIEENLYTIPLEIEFIGENKNYFDTKIMRYVSENTSNFNISTKQFRASPS